MKTKVLSILLILLLVLSFAPIQPVKAADGGTVSRIFGNNRYETAVEISKTGWDSSDSVVLARGDEFADALAGVPLAYALDAPILLTHPSKLHSATRAELARLGAQKVIILGGAGAVSTEVENILKLELGLEVDRIAGANRYRTAGLIAQRMKDMSAYRGKVMVVNGLNFPDALAASVYAAWFSFPIILVESNRIPPGSQEALAALDPVGSYVIGGKGVVSSAIFNALPEPERISGSNRYATAIALAEHFELGSKKCYVATGLNFADAIAGGVLAAKENASLLLVSKTLPSSVSSYLEDSTLNQAIIFGGPGAVSEETAASIDESMPFSLIDYFAFHSATNTIVGYDPAGGPDVVIPATLNGVAVKHIGAHAFWGLGITSVVISDSVETIESWAFGSNELTSLELSSNLEIIGPNAFTFNKLTNVVIPNSVITIEERAFSRNNLTSVTIGNSVETIVKYAFYLNDLNSVVIPNSVTFIGNGVFQTNKLTSVTIGSSVETISENAFADNNIISVVIPGNVKTVAEFAFWKNSLTSVVISNGVGSIGDGAFRENELTKITIGSGVDIGDNLLNPNNDYFRDAYSVGGSGTYVGTQGGTWSKQ